MLHAEGSSGNACCEEVHVLHTPNRGRFGWPSASILGAYKWRDGQFVSDGRAEDALADYRASRPKRARVAEIEDAAASD